MRRLILLPCLAILATTLLAADAGAAIKGVRASFENATGDPVRMVVRTNDDRVTRTVAPGDTLRRVTADGGWFGGDVWFEMGDCGTLSLGNTFVLPPSATLILADHRVAETGLPDEGSVQRLKLGGTRVTVRRLDDSADHKEIAVTLDACGERAEVPTSSGGLRGVNASFTNDTDDPVRLAVVSGTDDDGDRRRARTVDPGETVRDLRARSGSTTTNLGLETAKCGTLVLSTSIVGWPTATLSGKGRGADTARFDEGETHDLLRDGNGWTVERRADSGAFKEFGVTLELCG